MDISHARNILGTVATNMSDDAIGSTVASFENLAQLAINQGKNIYLRSDENNARMEL